MTSGAPWAVGVKQALEDRAHRGGVCGARRQRLEREAAREVAYGERGRVTPVDRGRWGGEVHGPHRADAGPGQGLQLDGTALAIDLAVAPDQLLELPASQSLLDRQQVVEHGADGRDADVRTEQLEQAQHQSPRVRRGAVRRAAERAREELAAARAQVPLGECPLGQAEDPCRRRAGEPVSHEPREDLEVRAAELVLELALGELRPQASAAPARTRCASQGPAQATARRA